jgi:LuxR family maltose regulon positive regulatory protein
VEIRQADLRFTAEEAADFLRRVMRLELSSADITVLHRRTEGWIAGLQLAALSMQGRDDAHQLVQSFAGSHRYILDYLIEEVFQRQPADVQDFLLKTSILDRFTAPLCDAIAERDDSRGTSKTDSWTRQCNTLWRQRIGTKRSA